MMCSRQEMYEPSAARARVGVAATVGGPSAGGPAGRRIPGRRARAAGRGRQRDHDRDARAPPHPPRPYGAATGGFTVTVTLTGS